MKSKILIYTCVLGFLCGVISTISAQTFDFNNGTTQNWTLNQMYETSTQKKITPYSGFVLSNQQNQLVATAWPVLINDATVKSYDIYLESPDLSSNSNWQNIAGYSIDLKRTLASPAGEPPNFYFAQLQLKVIDTGDNNKEKLFAEHNGTNWVFHAINSIGKNYHFVWKPAFLSNPKYKVKQIRIRLTGPGDPSGQGSGEWLPKGSWLLDNVSVVAGATSSIVVDVPNGGEVWEAGTPHIIVWHTLNYNAPVKIEYSTNGGSSYSTIIASTANSGSYTWNVPNTPSTQCRVRISDAATGTPSDESDANFTIAANEAIILDVPNGGESWEAGTPHYIVWHNHLFNGPVKIEYSTDGGTNYFTIVATTANTGSYAWNVPNTPSTQCRVRISDATDGNPFDVSDANFTITATESITLDVPNGGEKWGVGSPHIIVWHNHLFNDPVKIEYSTDGGANYSTIIASTANSGSYTWSIPTTPSTNCLVKVSDATDGNPWDVSDASFTIFTTTTNNTSAGSNVQVPLGSGVEIKFDNVTGSGTTTLNTKASGSPPPGGFSILPMATPIYYEITTTASYTGNIEICVQYNAAGLTAAQMAALKLQVYESPPGQWIDVTSAHDVSNHIICGKVSHLSDFAVMAPSGGVGSPTHFAFTAYTGDSYSIVIEDAALDGSPLEVGDEIGVFTPLDLCVGASVWDGNTPLALTAWADDTQTPEVDGYANGEAMFFKIWDASANAEYAATPTYAQGNGNFGDGAFAQISLLNAVTSVTQALSLPQGWSWISFNVQPSDLSIENVMAGVTNLAIVVNGAGQFYIPNVVNSIGQMNILEGYKIYVNASDQVSVTGNPVAATTPISLVSGWNFVSYLPSSSMAVETALASVLSELAIVKNDEGKFFIPTVINSLGNMTPGKGYKLYLNADATLTYPQGSSIAKVARNTPASKNISPRHFKFRARTGESYSVVIHSLRVEGKGPTIGDEVGIFTTSGLCVGVGVWNGSGVLGISAWVDDERTSERDGFREGEEMRFKFWDADEGKEIPLTAIFRKGGGKFGDGAFAVVDLESVRVPTTFSLEQNYPNPFNTETVISYQLPQAGRVVLKVYNLLGEEVQTLVDEKKNAGSYRTHWDGRNHLGKAVPSGIYIYRLNAGPFSAVKKAVLVK